MGNVAQHRHKTGDLPPSLATCQMLLSFHLLMINVINKLKVLKFVFNIMKYNFLKIDITTLSKAKKNVKEITKSDGRR